MTTFLKADEIDVTEWFVSYDGGTHKWIVARNYDTIGTTTDGEICYGMRSEIDSEHANEKLAILRLNEINNVI